MAQTLLARHRASRSNTKNQKEKKIPADAVKKAAVKKAVKKQEKSASRSLQLATVHCSGLQEVSRSHRRGQLEVRRSGVLQITRSSGAT